VSVEWFTKLKEIDSLSKMRINHLKKKSEQEDRVSKLNEKRHERLKLIEELKQNSVSIRHELGDLETKLKTASEQKQRLIDLGGDDAKIARFSSEIETLEERGMELLQKDEDISVEINSHKEFLQGLEKTIHEIETDFQPKLQEIDKEISAINLRLGLLRDELPVDFRTQLDRTTSKNLAHGPFTRVEQGSCYFCRYKISRIDESEIDMQQKLKTCPQCSRIFLPYGA
jgi:predicted  nucleic acid-binding Zn-ribbon protein